MCPHEIELGFGDKNLRADHQSSCGNHNINEGQKAPRLYATDTPTIEHPLINTEVAPHEGRMKKGIVRNDSEWMKREIERDKETLGAQERQATSNSVEEYGHYWGENVVEQVWLEEIYGIRREEVDLNVTLTKDVWNENGTASIWDSGYESPEED